MRMVRAAVIAFSMYSQIPMPRFEWEKEDMKYMLCFFPWVGATVGAGVYLWGMLCRYLEAGVLCYTCIGAVLPLLVTGGFHADGFMDTMDAFHSYQSREKKLDILKDSHIGAFSVLMFAVYGLIYMGAFSEISEKESLAVVCAGFFLSRCLSGIAVVSFPPARTDGLLYHFADSAHKRAVKITLYIQGILCIALMLCICVSVGGMAAAAAVGAFAYYYRRCKRELGGITGDTAGYFVLICECSIVAAAAVAGKLPLL